MGGDTEQLTKKRKAKWTTSSWTWARDLTSRLEVLLQGSRDPSRLEFKSPMTSQDLPRPSSIKLEMSRDTSLEARDVSCPSSYSNMSKQATEKRLRVRIKKLIKASKPTLPILDLR